MVEYLKTIPRSLIQTYFSRTTTHYGLHAYKLALVMNKGVQVFIDFVFTGRLNKFIGFSLT